MGQGALSENQAVEQRESPVTAPEGSAGVPLWTLALAQIVPALCLTSIAIVALWTGGIDGKDVALSATSGLAGFAAARGLTK